jgi:predicted nucleotidyltransferase
VSVRANFGGLPSERDALDAVVARVAAAVDPQAIYLSGSRARGQARPDSDFDLLVVGRPGALGSDDYETVDRAINGLGIGCDLVPCSAEDFRAAMTLRTSFVAQVLSEAHCVYGSP